MSKYFSVDDGSFSQIRDDLENGDQGPVSQSYLLTKICLKIKFCHKIVILFIITVSQNFHILSNKSDVKIILRSVL
jgi:hypothetical protein